MFWSFTYIKYFWRQDLLATTHCNRGNRNWVVCEKLDGGNNPSLSLSDVFDLSPKVYILFPSYVSQTVWTLCGLSIIQKPRQCCRKCAMKTLLAYSFDELCKSWDVLHISRLFIIYTHCLHFLLMSLLLQQDFNTILICLRFWMFPSVTWNHVVSVGGQKLEKK